MKKVGFLIGAGAELSYEMPSGGKFALEIFRQDPSNSKESFRKMRDDIDSSTMYASKWLPDNYQNNNIHVFGKRVFDTIIKDTVGNNREEVINKINSFDEVAREALQAIKRQHKTDLAKIIYEDLNNTVENININQKLKYTKLFDEGNKLFKNNYFAVLLEYYNSYTHFSDEEKKELREILKAIFQLQLGAISEKRSRELEDNIFEKKDLDIDIFDELGGNLNVNYETAGVKGLELLAQVDKEKVKHKHKIIQFAYEIIESIYSDVLDYKSLIDSNWHYLYNPLTEWAKFCRIGVFLYTVQEYIKEQGKRINKENNGYYHDLIDRDFKIEIIATTNYNVFIKEILKEDVVFLNGSIEEYYDPYLNAIGNKNDLNERESHFIVPLLFTQSGTKPMTSIDMAMRYVDFYERLKKSDFICSIGFGFNPDDEHINGIIRTLIDKDNKSLYIVDVEPENKEEDKRDEFVRKLKVINSNNIKLITVNSESRKVGNKLWVEILSEYTK